MASQTDRVSLRIPAALSVLAVLLCAGLLYRHHTAKVDKKWNLATMAHYSNEWVTTSHKLTEQKALNLSLEHNLDNQTEEFRAVSNKLAVTSAQAVETQTAAQTAAEAVNSQMGKQDARIAELESERNGMTKTLDGLTQSISKLETDIADVERKLEASKGDRALLVQELKRLQAEKSELERRFNSLALVREQVRKLRNELSLSRRLDWIRQGLMGGFQGKDQLLKGLASAAPAQASYNLDVELRRDGAPKVLPTDSSVASH